MDMEMLRFAICVIGCAIATYYDLFNRRNVPSWLSYSLVAIGALFTLASLDVNIIAYNGGVALLIFVFGYLLYRTGQIGGADVLMFVSIALLVPNAPHSIFMSTQSWLNLPFVVSVFLLSGILAVFGIFLQYIPPTAYSFLKGEKVEVNTSQVLLAFVLLVFYGAFIYYLSGIIGLPKAQLILIVAVIVCALCLFGLKDYISDRYMIRSVGIKEIDEEDILAIEKMDPKLVKKYKLDRLLTPREVEKLKKIGKNKKFPVYKEMPVFMPYVLIAMLASLFFGDPLAYLFPLSLLS